MREEERRAGGGSEPQGGAHGDRRRSSGVHGVNDLAAVDALQVDGCEAEVAVSELALDDDQWYALASHLDGVGVSELVRREAAPRSCYGRRAPQVCPCRSR
jgi:hypothetical protein